MRSSLYIYCKDFCPNSKKVSKKKCVAIYQIKNAPDISCEVLRSFKGSKKIDFQSISLVKTCAGQIGRTMQYLAGSSFSKRKYLKNFCPNSKKFRKKKYGNLLH